jgi:hypothetical protein
MTNRVEFISITLFHSAYEITVEARISERHLADTYFTKNITPTYPARNQAKPRSANISLATIYEKTTMKLFRHANASPNLVAVSIA